jgi:hypothetical protein
MIYEEAGALIKHVTRIAVHYPYFATGTIPAGKDKQAVDEKLIELYQTELDRVERQKRRRNGLSNARYLRCRHTWVLLVTKGMGSIWDAEPLKDMRETELIAFDYSIKLLSRSGKRYDVQTKISNEVWEEHERLILANALRRSTSSLEAFFVLRAGNYTRTPFRGSMGQITRLFDEINRRRKSAGLELLSRLVLGGRARS